MTLMDVSASRPAPVPPLADATEAGALGIFQLKRYWSRTMAMRQSRVVSTDKHDRHLDHLVIHATGLGLEQTVVFAGTTTTPWDVYRSADVVAMASVSEAFPYAVIESMLCGAAVVATDVGGVREALGPAGILVNARDPSALATAILDLLAAPGHRQKLGAAARARALRHFTEDKFVAEYRASYRRLVDGEAVPGAIPADLASLSTANPPNVQCGGGGMDGLRA